MLHVGVARVLHAPFWVCCFSCACKICKYILTVLATAVLSLHCYTLLLHSNSHEACIDAYLNTSKLCPVCRQDLEKLSAEQLAATAASHTAADSSNGSSSNSLSLMQRLKRLSARAGASSSSNSSNVEAAGSSAAARQSSSYRRWQSL
jgi:hypothetical protein